MSDFIEVQTMIQNTGNWQYTIKGSIEYYNPKYIKRITPTTENCYKIWMEGDDQQYCTAVINSESFQKLQGMR